MAKILVRFLRGVKNPRKALAFVCRKYLASYDEFSYDFYKNGEYDLLLKLSKIPFRTIFDVGANIGDWSTIAKKLFPKASIHCFELSRTTFQTLSGNLSGDQFVLNNLGMSDKTCSIKYKDYGENSGVNTILLNAKFHDKTIKPQLLEGSLVSGDEYCKNKDVVTIDFLKVDVEGAEHLVLNGFNEMLKKHTIRIVQFEYGYTNGDAKFLMRDFYEFFENHGYQVGKIRRGKIDFSEWIYQYNDFNSGPNYVAIQKDDTELKLLLG